MLVLRSLHVSAGHRLCCEWKCPLEICGKYIFVAKKRLQQYDIVPAAVLRAAVPTLAGQVTMFLE